MAHLPLVCHCVRAVFNCALVSIFAPPAAALVQVRLFCAAFSANLFDLSAGRPRRDNERYRRAIFSWIPPNEPPPPPPPPPFAGQPAELPSEAIKSLAQFPISTLRRHTPSQAQQPHN